MVSTALQVNRPLAQQVKVRIQCDQVISRPSGKGGPGRVVGPKTPTLSSMISARVSVAIDTRSFSLHP